MTVVSGRPDVYITETFQPLASAGTIPGAAYPAIAALHPRGPERAMLITSWGQFTSLYGGFSDSPGSMLPFAVWEFFANGGSAVFVLRLANTDASVASIILQDVGADSLGALTLTAASRGAWGNLIAVTIAVNRANHFNLSVALINSSGVAVVKETWNDLSMSAADTRYCIPILNAPNGAGSRYVTAASVLPGAYVLGTSDLVAVSGVNPAGGADGVTTPTSLSALAIAELDLFPAQINAVNLPGVSNTTELNAMISWAASTGNKVIVCDGPAPTTAGSGSVYAAAVTNTYVSLASSGLTASSYAALYAPYLLVSDPSSTASAASRYLPPGPAMLASFQVNDVLDGPSFAPAGIRLPLASQLVVALETTFSNTQLDTLNNAHVNVIKSVPNVGYCIWGARTLLVGMPSMYVNVRRQAIQIEHDCTFLLSFAVFEPNGPSLWSQITYVIDTYLGQQFQAGAFAGTSAADSYQIVCDSSNNSVSDAQAGRVTVQVGVALMSPAEFIQFNLTQLTASAS